MRVDVYETDRRMMVADAEEAAQDDAAVASENEHECAAVRRVLHTFGQRAGIGFDLSLIPRPARRTHDIPIGQRDLVAEVAGAEPCSEACLPQRGGCEVESANTAVVVGADPDARRRADNREGPNHS